MKKKKNNELKRSTIVLGIIFLSLLFYRTIEWVYLELVEEEKSESVSLEEEVFEVQVAVTQTVITATPMNILPTESPTDNTDELHNPLLTHSNELEINTSTATAIAFVTEECQQGYYLSLRKLGFDVRDSIVALQIMHLETGCNPKPYEYGNEKVGIMGISTEFCDTTESNSNPTVKYLKDVLGEYDCIDLADTSLNLYAAYLIFTQEGWESWDTYTEYKLGIIESAD